MQNRLNYAVYIVLKVNGVARMLKKLCTSRKSTGISSDLHQLCPLEAQWLSGRVLDSRPASLRCGP